MLSAEYPGITIHHHPCAQRQFCFLLPYPDQSLTWGRQHKKGGYRLENIKKFGGGVVASFAQPVSVPIIAAIPGHVSQTQTNPSPNPDGAFVVWKPHRVDERLKRQEGMLSWYHSDSFRLIATTILCFAKS